jgi:hypothetical protein
MDDLKGLAPENLNIRYLAWTIESDPVKWAAILHKKTGLMEKRAKAICDGVQPTYEERVALAAGFDIRIDELSSPGLFGLPSKEIIKENIKYLMTGFPRGERKKMAVALHVTQETVSRWHKTGVTNSNRPPEILRYLGLDPTIELDKIPLFLSFQPIGKYAQRRWFLNRLDEISSTELSKLFPLLQKLFGGHETH